MKLWGRREQRGTMSAEQAQALDVVGASTMLDRPRLLSLWEQVVTCERDAIAGAFVECGVWKGGAVAWMSQASASTGAPPRDLHLFDAFDDICEPDPAVDGELALKMTAELTGITDPAGRLRPMAGAYDGKGGHGTVDGCRALLSQVGHPAERVHFHVGWFQDTVPGVDVGPIAILRLDGDWYASTKVCLDHLYDAVAPGGFVVIDDYHTFDGCRLAVEEFRDARGIEAPMTTVGRDAAWWRR